MPGCINRNIVECKDELPTSLNISGVGINRNIVECKDRGQSALQCDSMY